MSVVAKDDSSNEVVRLGSIVTVVMNKVVKTFTIVRPDETRDGGFISYTFPIGKALLGHSKYETVVANLPSGNIPLFILEVDNTMVTDEDSEDTKKRLSDLEEWVSSLDGEFNDRLGLLEACFREILCYKPMSGFGWDKIIPRLQEIIGVDPKENTTNISVSSEKKTNTEPFNKFQNQTVYHTVLPHSKNLPNAKQPATDLQRVLFAKENLEVATNLPDDTVRLGSLVTMFSRGEKSVILVVKPEESNPMQDCLSYESPIVEVMLGHKRGETVVAYTPDGDVSIEILAIDNK